MKIQSLNHLKPFMNRIIAVLFLLLILFALCVYYYDNYEINAEYPSIKTILSNYPEGKGVSVSGSVVGIYEEGFYLKDTYNGEKLVYKVNSSSKATISDKVSILGTLGPSYTINASKVLIHKKWKEDFVLFRSMIGGIFLLLIFWRYWKFDFKNTEFIRLKKPRFLNHKNRKFLRRK